METSTYSNIRIRICSVKVDDVEIQLSTSITIIGSRWSIKCVQSLLSCSGCRVGTLRRIQHLDTVHMLQRNASRPRRASNVAPGIHSNKAFSMSRNTDIRVALGPLGVYSATSNPALTFVKESRRYKLRWRCLL